MLSKMVLFPFLEISVRVMVERVSLRTELLEYCFPELAQLLGRTPCREPSESRGHGPEAPGQAFLLGPSGPLLAVFSVLSREWSLPECTKCVSKLGWSPVFMIPQDGVCGPSTVKGPGLSLGSWPSLPGRGHTGGQRRCPGAAACVRPLGPWRLSASCSGICTGCCRMPSCLSLPEVTRMTRTGPCATAGPSAVGQPDRT